MDIDALFYEPKFDLARTKHYILLDVIQLVKFYRINSKSVIIILKVFKSSFLGLLLINIVVQIQI